MENLGMKTERLKGRQKKGGGDISVEGKDGKRNKHRYKEETEKSKNSENGIG